MDRARLAEAARVSVRAGWVLACAAVLSGAGVSCGGTDSPAGAGGSAPVACGRPFAGDPALPVELQLTYRGADGQVHALGDHGSVPLVTPPQGGKVLFVGVRARNVSPCNVELVGALRDPASAQVTIDGRSGLTLVQEADGWLASDNGAIANFANISACPNQWSSVDVFDKDYSLSVTLTTKGPTKAGDASSAVSRRAETVITVKPSCDGDVSGALACTCICKAGYSLGQVCE